MRTATDISGINQILKQIQDRLDNLERNNIDFHGRRIVNAGKSVDKTDYVIKQELEDQINGLINNQPSDFKNLLVRQLQITNGILNIVNSTISVDGNNALAGANTVPLAAITPGGTAGSLFLYDGIVIGLILPT